MLTMKSKEKSVILSERKRVEGPAGWKEDRSIPCISQKRRSLDSVFRKNAANFAQDDTSRWVQIEDADAAYSGIWK